MYNLLWLRFQSSAKRNILHDVIPSDSKADPSSRKRHKMLFFNQKDEKKYLCCFGKGESNSGIAG